MLLMLATLACTKGEDSGDSDSAAPCEDNVWGADADADGYGSASFTLTGCEQPVGYVDNTDDCDDTNSDYYPGAMVWLDDDGDGYGAAEQVASDCEGFVDNGDDCDDGDAEVNPDADEVCDDGIDNDCSGDAPECGLSGEVLLGSAWAVISGDAGDQLGGPVRGVGDWNSDGRDDFAVSARGDDTAGDGAGAVLIYTSGGAMDLGKADAKTTWTGAGASSGIFGVWPVGGDITGDGKDDLAVSSRNDEAVYLLPYGKLGNHSVTEGVTLSGTEGNVDFATLGQIGDLNGDGTPDLVVNAQKSNLAATKAGATWVFYGPIASDSNEADIGFRLTGANEGDQAGGLSGLGDVDGDGLADFAVGAPFADGTGTDSGAVYIITNEGGADAPLADLASSILWGGDGDQAGWAIAPAGDHDGDGTLDVLIGVQRDDANTSNGNEGAVHVITSLVAGESDIETVAAVRMVGDAVDDRVSNCASGDANADGNPDILVGVRFNDEAGTDSGSVYLFYGPLPSGTTDMGNANAQILGQGAGDGLGAPATFGGDLNADGAQDLLMGARWNDSNGEDSGRVYVLPGGGI